MLQSQMVFEKKRFSLIVYRVSPEQTLPYIWVIAWTPPIKNYFTMVQVITQNFVLICSAPSL